MAGPAATVRNVSAHGLLLCAAHAPSAGAYIEVVVGAETIAARTIWVANQTFGVRSRSQLNFDALRQTGSRATRNAAQASFRAAALPAAAKTDFRRAAEVSRSRSYALQFITAAVVGLLVAGSIGWEVYQTLSAPLAEASNAMALIK